MTQEGWTLTAASTLTAKSGGRIASIGSVTLVPNAVIAVDGGSSVEIGAAGAPATGSISIDAAGGQVNGDGTLAGPVINNGTIDANFASAGSNTLEITGALTGDGEIVISNGFNISPDVYEPGAVLRLDAPVANTQSIIFGTNFDPAAAATLILADPSAFAGTLYDLNGSGSAIDLPGETLTGASVNGSTLTVTVASGGPFTFNLGYGTPTTGQLVVSGSELHVLPDRSFVWTGATSDDVSVAGNWNDTTDAANPAATAPTATDLVLITNAGLITGTGTARRTVATSAMVPIRLSLTGSMKAPRWPPASKP